MLDAGYSMPDTGFFTYLAQYVRNICSPGPDNHRGSTRGNWNTTNNVRGVMSFKEQTFLRTKQIKGS